MNTYRILIEKFIGGEVVEDRELAKKFTTIFYTVLGYLTQNTVLVSSFCDDEGCSLTVKSTLSLDELVGEIVNLLRGLLNVKKVTLNKVSDGEYLLTVTVKGVKYDLMRISLT